MSTKNLLLILSFGAIVTFSSSCKEDEQPDPTPADPTLYQRVGGTTMVDDPANPGTQIEQGRLTLRSVVDSSIFNSASIFSN